MKKISFIVAMMAMVFLFSCTENAPDLNIEGNENFAYLSIKVQVQPQTRGSDEQVASTAENDIKSLYLITFNNTGGIIGVPGSKVYYNVITAGGSISATPDAVKVAKSAENLVVIANPGAKLLAVINGLNGASTFESFNSAITGVSTGDIVDASKGFAMITSGDETGKDPDGAAPANQILNPFVKITGRMVSVSDTDAKAKAEAELEANRVPVKLERLAAKLVVKVSESVKTPDGAVFKSMKWTVDAVNGTYFPFAVKTLRSNHTATDYQYNFYTKDPNYTDNAGIVYGEISANTGNNWSYEPVLPWTDDSHTDGYYGWKASADNAYLIENTMKEDKQLYQNATRLVIKATYYPKGFTSGDWFQWAGINYTLEQLKERYALNDSQDFVDACKNFFDAIKNYYSNTGKSGLSTDFSGLTESMLASVNNGGEVVKSGDKVIRWYQDGLNYYYYEIRHDNEADADMTFAKYGVVRNNWYNLTLNSVSGAGTPWYPEIKKPGPNDPDPEDPIDTEAGYLGITVSVGKWIHWETGFDI